MDQTSQNLTFQINIHIWYIGSYDISEEISETLHK